MDNTRTDTDETREAKGVPNRNGVDANSLQNTNQRNDMNASTSDNTQNKGSKKLKKPKNKTIYHVDGKVVHLNWFDKLRMSLMSQYEKQAFLAEKLLEQERKSTAAHTNT